MGMPAYEAESVKRALDTMADQLDGANRARDRLEAENAELREQIERLKREVLEWAWEDCRTYVNVDYIGTFHRLEKILEGEGTDGKEGIEEA